MLAYASGQLSCLMGLIINLRHLDRSDVTLQGELSVAELDIETHDEMMRASKPLQYDLTAQDIEGSLLVRGSLLLVLDCECVRCLKPFEFKVDMPDWACLLPLSGEDAVKVDGDSVDLTPILREDILLELPQHPLCKKSCGGLKKPTVGKTKKISKGDDKTSSAWADLDKLKFRKE